MKNILYLLILAVLLVFGCSENDANITPSRAGKGGSMARFAISGNYLYSVSNSKLNLFNIIDTHHPVKEKSLSVGWGIETIYPYKNYLFMGSQTGMYIYNNTDPANPEFLSNYQHIFSCDPVVVDDNYAYITLRDGSSCRQGDNRLEIVDIKDLTNPQLKKSYNMTNPYGLGIDQNKLFVCDDGLKVYDATDPLNLQLLKHFEINAYDVIPDNGRLSVIGSDGFYQYSYSGSEITFLSKLALPNQ
ncbi:MAG TPA: hypothetical protein VD908_06700 [Cytophagales bacterium]|nr:hypothetical protein [Cytophagales bacterium]